MIQIKCFSEYEERYFEESVNDFLKNMDKTGKKLIDCKYQIISSKVPLFPDRVMYFATITYEQV